MMKQLREEFPDVPIKLVWDGAPYHRANKVKEEGNYLGITIEPLPGYSPDFMPVEHLWQWLREDVTYHTCYERKKDLIAQVKDFQEQINAAPLDIADRLWVTTHLEPEMEKLRFST